VIRRVILHDPTVSLPDEICHPIMVIMSYGFTTLISVEGVATGGVGRDFILMAPRLRDTATTTGTVAS